MQEFQQEMGDGENMTAEDASKAMGAFFRGLEEAAKEESAKQEETASE
jgi:hypothetical protein